ncbi:MAG: HTTM domain-containing protein, partial [Pseudomonadota bacterium]
MVVTLLFLLTAAAATSLLLGYRTRPAGWLTWALVMSLHYRNPMLVDSGDVLLRCLLFWGDFLPWG